MRLSSLYSGIYYLIFTKQRRRTLQRLYERILVTYLQISPPLTYLAIEINSACNRACPWCPNANHQRPPDRFLDEQYFYKIINEAQTMRFRGSITLNLFNEPLLDPRVTKFIHYIREHLPEVHINLNTNGDLLTLETWLELRQAGLDYAKISQYDGKINANIQQILDHLDDEEKPHFGAYVFTAQKIRNRAGLIRTKSQLPQQRYCKRPFYQLCITYEGKGVLCCNDYFGQIEIGHIATQSIQEMWKSDVLMRYRKELARNNRAGLPLCRGCDM